MSSTPRRPEYRVTADTIRSRIRNGTYEAGGRLPTGKDLAAELDVSQGTAEKALRVLAREGIITMTTQGTYVSRIPDKIQRLVPDRYEAEYRERGHGAFDVEIREHGHEPRWETSVIQTDSHSVKTRRMWADGVPVQLATTRVPVAVASEVDFADTTGAPGGIISRMAANGHRQHELVEEIEVRPPTTEEAAFLELTEDHRVYELTHTAYTRSGIIVETTVHVMPTHLWRLVYRWHPDQS